MSAIRLKTVLMLILILILILERKEPGREGDVDVEKTALDHAVADELNRTGPLWQNPLSALGSLGALRSLRSLPSPSLSLSSAESRRLQHHPHTRTARVVTSSHSLVLPLSPCPFPSSIMPDPA